MRSLHPGMQLVKNPQVSIELMDPSAEGITKKMVSARLTETGTGMYMREPVTLSAVDSNLNSLGWNLHRIKNRELENKIIGTCPVLTWVGTDVSGYSDVLSVLESWPSERYRISSTLPTADPPTAFVWIAGSPMTCFLSPASVLLLQHRRLPLLNRENRFS